MNLPAEVQKVMNNGLLDTIILEGLTPHTRFTAIADDAEFEGNAGDTKSYKKRGLLSPDISHKNGVDPTPDVNVYEEFSITTNEFSGSTDTDFLLNYMSVPEKMLGDAKSLAIKAGRSIDLLCRQALFRSYLSGQTRATAGGSGATALPVASCNGFSTVMVNNKPIAVSATYPLQISIGGTTRYVTACTPDDANYPFGSGVLTLSAPHTWSQYAYVKAVDAPYIYRVGGGDSIDAIENTDVLTLAAIRAAKAATFAENFVEPFANGMFQLHLSEASLSELYNDSEFQNLMKGQIDTEEARRGVLGRIMGVELIINENVPKTTNVADVDEIGAEITNASGVAVKRAILLGRGALDKRTVNMERVYGMAKGAMQRWNDLYNGAAININGVAWVVRPPIDRKMMKPALTYEAGLGFACQTDFLTPYTGGARYKRAVVIEHY